MRSVGDRHGAAAFAAARGSGGARSQGSGAAVQAPDGTTRRRAWCGTFVLLAALLAVFVGRVEALVFALGALACCLPLPAVAHLARRRGLVRLPGGRAAHETPTPLLGGLALLLPLGLLLLGRALLEDPAWAFVLLGALLLFLVGLRDDARGLRAWQKMLAQLAAGGLLLAAGFSLPALSLPPLAPLELGPFGPLVLLGWVLFLTNAFNLVDGMDGLAGTLALVAAAVGLLGGADPLLALGLGGAALGFLRHNLPPARVFLGDAGSLPLGYLVAALALTLPGPGNAALALALAAFPLGDLVLTVSRRTLRGKPIFAADQSHLHHKLLRLWGAPGPALGLAAALALGLGTAGLLLPGLWAAALVFLVWGLLVVLLYLTHRDRLRAFFPSRRDFRWVHVARRYAQERIQLARTSADVCGALERLLADLSLDELRLGRLHYRAATNGHPTRRVDIPLASGRRAFATHPLTDGPPLQEEKQAAVCEILRQADQRLDELAAGQTPAQDAPPAGASAPLRAWPEGEGA